MADGLVADLAHGRDGPRDGRAGVQGGDAVAEGFAGPLPAAPVSSVSSSPAVSAQTPPARRASTQTTAAATSEDRPGRAGFASGLTSFSARPGAASRTSSVAPEAVPRRAARSVAPRAPQTRAHRRAAQPVGQAPATTPAPRKTAAAPNAAPAVPSRVTSLPPGAPPARPGGIYNPPVEGVRRPGAASGRGRPRRRTGRVPARRPRAFRAAWRSPPPAGSRPARSARERPAAGPRGSGCHRACR
ncbi:hypothetical protein STANM309S_05290 [Streptomyces tanashiensis]